ncbi:hypothetical protein KDK_18540 [Dictyobacter kobayashii]|uniref:1,4-dihydroxy-2-naphthoate octaprenyltransferase n=1 Tax=Dictyobacter kobayashii TaxID=2014872 RepID=A0A402AG74_9CHLR|nr:UbiA family prenyltransferase [Dictyobacter kobayashii]GCE18054.1 hypothetical protein KDK_18540 [Dictyobacter kobayashii]
MERYCICAGDALIPVYAFVGVGHYTPALICLIPVAALLGIALNLANSLPDIAEDAANKARTLAVVLGEQRTRLACPLLILATEVLVIIFAVMNVVNMRAWIIWPTLGLVFMLVVWLFGWSYRGLRPLNYRHYFLLVVCTCLLLASGWLTSIFLV